jgi:soluble lytic murein transglycosylase-like protein
MFDAFIQAASRQYNVPESWIRAVIETESSWNPNAYRAEPQINDASYGLMQLLLGTAKGLGYTGNPTGLYDPQTNIDLGSHLLGDLRDRYGDDFRRIYSAYNSGRPDLWETSTQVAANVKRAMENLSQWVQESAAQVAASPTSGPLAIGAILLLLWWSQKTRS